MPFGLTHSNHPSRSYLGRGWALYQSSRLTIYSSILHTWKAASRFPASYSHNSISKRAEGLSVCNHLHNLLMIKPRSGYHSVGKFMQVQYFPLITYIRKLLILLKQYHTSTEFLATVWYVKKKISGHLR